MNAKPARKRFLQSPNRYVSLRPLDNSEHNFFKASAFTIVLHLLAKLITAVFHWSEALCKLHFEVVFMSQIYAELTRN